MKLIDSCLSPAELLWKLQFGSDKVVTAGNFDCYLASIPQVPANLLADDYELPYLSLADPRPGLFHVCRLLGILHKELGHKEGEAALWDERFTLPAEPFWFRHDDGRKNRNRRPDECREELVGNIMAGTALEGVFAYVHHPTILTHQGDAIDCPGTGRRGSRAFSARVRKWNGDTECSLRRDFTSALPLCGSIRVRRK